MTSSDETLRRKPLWSKNTRPRYVISLDLWYVDSSSLTPWPQRQSCSVKHASREIVTWCPGTQGAHAGKLRKLRPIVSICIGGQVIFSRIVKTLSSFFVHFCFLATLFAYSQWSCRTMPVEDLTWFSAIQGLPSMQRFRWQGSTPVRVSAPTKPQRRMTTICPPPPMYSSINPDMTDPELAS